MTVAQAPIKRYTAEEYLEREVASEFRSEFRNGEIIEMTGGTPAHNKIASALNALLWFGLRGKPFNVFVTDQRFWIPGPDLYTYPDVVVTSEPLGLKEGRSDTVINPIFVAEVLSKSTKDYERDEKFAAYRTIPMFQEYLLVDQYRHRVEQFVRQDANQWLLTVHDGLDAKVSLASLPVEVLLADLYENIEFEVD
jgi:Uma2 family endonuclease